MFLICRFVFFLEWPLLRIFALLPAAAFAKVEGKSLQPDGADYTFNVKALHGSELSQAVRPNSAQEDYRLDARMVQFKFLRLRPGPFPDDFFVDADSMVELSSQGQLNEVAKYLQDGDASVRRQLLNNLDAA